MKVNAIKLNSSNKQRNKNISFTANPLKYAVINGTKLSKSIPIIAFAGSVMSALGYLVGSLGLFYDSHIEKSQKERGNLVPFYDSNHKMFRYIPNPKSQIGETSIQEDGVKTIKTSTAIGKNCMTFAKVGMFSSALGGLTCGIGEGMPLMTAGEATNLFCAPIIETPIGTGLFGIGIASIFSSLALDNTPELKLNHYRMLATNNRQEKAKLVLENAKNCAKEVLVSVKEIVKNIANPKFLKENFFQGTPKNIVFREFINKDGKVTLDKALRHNRGYLMHAASFTLGLGGLGLIATSLLKMKFAQKTALKAEEGGFLMDNLGITRYGMDKFTVGAKGSGASFATGGVINAISQFMGIDNKNGRAMQWLGISLVFLGYSIDRGKFLRSALKNSKIRTELTDVVREWKVDLSKIITNPKKLKKLLKEIKYGKEITDANFIKLEKAIKNAVNEGGQVQDENTIRTAFETLLNKRTTKQIQVNNIAQPKEIQDILRICTRKMFGSETPTPIKEA